VTHARRHRIQVVAHRGASEEAPEHTLAAYKKAIEDGADALECDVRLTADGHLVCVHDRRVNRTSNGRGAVSALELADLAALDFGSRKTRELWRTRDEEPDWEFRPEDREDTSVLTLERLLELVADAMGVRDTNVALFSIVLLFLLGLALNFSVIMSRQAAQITRLAQERALERVRGQAGSGENGNEAKRERLES